MVNARLTLLDATAAEADEKFGGISGASQSCLAGSTDGACDRVAHICVTPWVEKTLKSPLLDRFLVRNQWSNRRPGQADRGEFSRQRLSVAGSEPIIPQTWSSTAPAGFSLCRHLPPAAARRFTDLDDETQDAKSQPPPHAHPPPLRIADSRARIPTVPWTRQRYR
jgi:hypothetical protein